MRLPWGLAALFILSAAHAPRAEAQNCPSFASAQEVGIQPNRTLGEISGMVASRTAPGVFWVHNDSGDTARIFALREDGTLLGEYALPSATANDWEDISMGPGEESGRDYLYIGDTGDNLRQRPFITVYRVLEPEVARDQSLITQNLNEVEAFELEYPSAPATVYDCEAMLVDPANGGLYLITKQADGESIAKVFHAAALSGESRTPLVEVASLSLGGTRFTKVTGADIRPSGGEVVLRLYGGVKLWRYSGSPNLGDVFSTPSCAVLVRLEPQSEAIAYGADGRDLYTTSEQATGDPQPILRYVRQGEEEGEGFVEGEGIPEGLAEGALEGVGDGEGAGVIRHTADQDGSGSLELNELLRVVQLFNADVFSCAEATEDGYQTGSGDAGCAPHTADYAPLDWKLSLSELLRVVQLYNLGSFSPCLVPEAEDGFCAQA